MFQLHTLTVLMTNNRFISIRPLHRQQEYRFIALAFPSRNNENPSYTAEVLSESKEYLNLRVMLDNTIYQLLIDFISNTIVLTK